MDTTTSPPPIVAEPNRGDIQRAFAILAETIANQPKVLTERCAAIISLPLIGMFDLHITSDGPQAALGFTAEETGATSITADECRGVAAFFARMASLLEEPK